MTQTFQKTIKIDSIEVEKHKAQTSLKDEIDDLLGDLNPRYFEEMYSLGEAKQRAYTLDLNVGSKFDFFSVF